jgi:hypothetical protein
MTNSPHPSELPSAPNAGNAAPGVEKRQWCAEITAHIVPHETMQMIWRNQ